MCHTFYAAFFLILRKSANIPGIIDYPLKFYIWYLYCIAILILKK